MLSWASWRCLKFEKQRISFSTLSSRQSCPSQRARPAYPSPTVQYTGISLALGQNGMNVSCLFYKQCRISIYHILIQIIIKSRIILSFSFVSDIRCLRCAVSSARAGYFTMLLPSPAGAGNKWSLHITPQLSVMTLGGQSCFQTINPNISVTTRI